MLKNAAIAFVPLNFVRVSWNGLKVEMPDDDKLEKYTAYFDEHGLMVTLPHTYETLQTLWPKDKQPSGRVAQSHEENIPEGTP